MRSDGNEDVRAGGAHVLEAEAPRPTAREGEAEIELRGVSKRYRSRDRETLALTDIDLGIRKQEFVTLLGQSGCGKTTMLRILAGLTKPTSGEVTIAGRPLWHGDHRDDDALRKLGLVFQDANLFPWYTVEENIGLPLLLRKVDKSERRRARARARRARRPAGLREGAPARALRRHAPARRHRPGPELQPRDPAHGRAVRRARRDDARQDEHRAAADRRGHAGDRRLRHPLDRRGRLPGRPRRAALRAAGADPLDHARSTRRARARSRSRPRPASRRRCSSCAASSPRTRSASAPGRGERMSGRSASSCRGSARPSRSS